MSVAFQAVGTAVSATTGTLTVAWPTHIVNDVALLFVASSASGTTASLSPSQGFVLIDSFGVGTGGSGVKFSIHWARANGTAMASPVVNAGSDFKYGFIATFRGAASIGSPINTYAGSVKGTASTSASIDSVTTTVAKALIVNAIADDLDSASAFVTSYTNTNISGLTKRFDAGTISGGGGGISFATGTMTTAGATGATSVVLTSSINSMFSIALTPETSMFNTFDGGADGATISTQNSGPGSGTFVGAVVKNVGTTLTFSATQARNTLSFCANYAVNAAGYGAWNWTSSVRSVMRFYVYFDSLQDATLEIARFASAGGRIAAIQTLNKQFIVNDLTAVQATAPDVLQVGIWYRAELAVTVGTTTSNGRIEFAYYHDNFTSPIYSYDSGATLNTSTTDTLTFRIGASTGPTPSALIVYYDDLSAQELTSGFIGPSVTYNKNQFFPFF